MANFLLMVFVRVAGVSVALAAGKLLLVIIC